MANPTLPPTPAMTSKKPYLIRAFYDWFSDNGFRPFVTVDCSHPGVKVPGNYVGKKTNFNLSMKAMPNIQLDNDKITGSARFGQATFNLVLPIDAIESIQSPDAGHQGIFFPKEEFPDVAPHVEAAMTPCGNTETKGADTPKPDGDKPKPRPNHLSVVK
jgi:stringent starvation protein B